MSGGVLFGIMGTLLTMARQLPGYDFFVTLSGTFVFGALAGLLHGFVLAIFARDHDMTFGDSLRHAALGLLYSLLAVPVAYLATLWIGFAFYYQLDPTLGRLLGAVIGGWIGLAVLVWTAWETWRAIRVIVERWPDFVVVVGIVSIVFLVLVWFFNSFYPYIFQGNYNLRQSVFISGGIAVLVVGPLTTIAFVGLRKLARIQSLIRKLEDGG